MSKGKCSFLVVIGVLSIILALYTGCFLSTYVYVAGVNWIGAGISYFSTHRKVTNGGFLAALTFGVLGAILWLIADMGSPKTKIQG